MRSYPALRPRSVRHLCGAARRRAARVSALLLVLLATGCATTQNAAPPVAGRQAPSNQDLKLAAYNVGLGAIVGGVGALLNGDDGPPLRRFVRGAGWGVVGGSVAYSGKWLAGEITASERLAYGLPVRLVHDLGISVVENAAHGNPPLDRLASHLGFVRLDVRPRSGDVQVRLLPVSAIAFGLLLARDDQKFAPGRSLAYGTPLFLGDRPARSPLFDGDSEGFVLVNSVFMNRNTGDFHELAAHELIHVLQNHEFVRAEAVLRARLDEPLRRSAAYRSVARWVYLDLPALNWIAYFAVSGGVSGGVLGGTCYFDNWFEREAEAFATRTPVGTCR